MALTIKENNGEFLLEGAINSSTAKDLKNHCEALLNAFGQLTINIEKITAIDTNGLAALRSLYNSALKYNQSFFITGTGCKEIYNEFRFTVAA